MPTDLKTAVQRYLRAGNLSPGTRKGCQATLNKWTEWGGGVPIEHLSRQEIRDFLDCVHEQAVLPTHEPHRSCPPQEYYAGRPRSRRAGIPRWWNATELERSATMCLGGSQSKERHRDRRGEVLADQRSEKNMRTEWTAPLPSERLSSYLQLRLKSTIIRRPRPAYCLREGITQCVPWRCKMTCRNNFHNCPGLGRNGQPTSLVNLCPLCRKELQTQTKQQQTTGPQTATPPGIPIRRRVPPRPVQSPPSESPTARALPELPDAVDLAPDRAPPRRPGQPVPRQREEVAAAAGPAHTQTPAVKKPGKLDMSQFANLDPAAVGQAHPTRKGHADEVIDHAGRHYICYGQDTQASCGMVCVKMMVANRFGAYDVDETTIKEKSAEHEGGYKPYFGTDMRNLREILEDMNLTNSRFVDSISDRELLNVTRPRYGALRPAIARIQWYKNGKPDGGHFVVVVESHDDDTITVLDPLRGGKITSGITLDQFRTYSNGRFLGQVVYLL